MSFLCSRCCCLHAQSSWLRKVLAGTKRADDKSRWLRVGEDSAALETIPYSAPREQIDFLGEKEGFGTPSSLLPCIPVKKALQEARRGTKRGLPKALESRRKIQPATRGRVVQNTHCASEAKATPLSFPAPLPSSMSNRTSCPCCSANMIASHSPSPSHRRFGSGEVIIRSTSSQAGRRAIHSETMVGVSGCSSSRKTASGITTRR